MCASAQRARTVSRLDGDRYAVQLGNPSKLREISSCTGVLRLERDRVRSDRRLSGYPPGQKPRFSGRPIRLAGANRA